MKIAIIKETRQFEERVSCTPEIVKKLISLGFKVSLESNAGASSSYYDEDYKKIGCEIVKSQKILLTNADLVFSIVRPEVKVLKLLKKSAVLICQMEAHINPKEIKECADMGITSFALEQVPRISRAQSMHEAMVRVSWRACRCCVLRTARLDGVESTVVKLTC